MSDPLSLNSNEPQKDLQGRPAPTVAGGTLETPTLKPNLLFRHGKSGWCRHGLVLIWQLRDTLYANDTYWRRGEHGCFDPADVAKNGTLIADLDDFRQVNESEYWRYAEADRTYIPMGARSEEWWVRKLAAPDKEQALERIAVELSTWESNKRIAEWRIAELLKEQQTYSSQEQ